MAAAWQSSMEQTMNVSRVPRPLRACPGFPQKRDKKQQQQQQKGYIGYMLQILVSQQLAPVSHLGLLRTWRQYFDSCLRSYLGLCVKK